MGLASLSKNMLEQRSLIGVAPMLALFMLAPSASLIYHGGWAGAFGLISTFGCLAAVARALIRSSLAERDIRALCVEDASASSSLPLAVSFLRQRLNSIGHRCESRHPVTGLPTREHLFAGIKDDLAGDCSHKLLGVIYFAEYDRLAGLDPDHASEILDGLAKRLSAAVGPRHILAQIDRHSFAIWLRADEDGTAATEMRALFYVAEQDIVTPSGRFMPKVEVGTAKVGDDCSSPEQLLARATAALNRTNASAAEGGPHPAEHDQQQERERLIIEQDLEHAIGKNQLRLVFQPLVDLGAGKLAGAEVLLRWTHPTLGPVSPALFIPIVERLGLSDRYGMWVLDAACRQLRHWRGQGLGALKMAVNLSACQLHDEQLPVKIARTLQLHGLPASVLELELTETAAMADIDRTRTLFAALRDLGISIAIDDFGSGYSSLSYLKNLRFDKLKIDREFVADIHVRSESRAICKALIELGRGLDLHVLAEGVETAEEVETLRGLGCTLFQGYYFSRPLEGEGLPDFINGPGLRSILASPVHHHMHELERRLSA